MYRYAHVYVCGVSKCSNMDLCRSMCVPVYRSSLAQLWINGVSYGVYYLVEDIDRDFLRSRFGESDGNLYKAGRLGATLEYYSDDPRCVPPSRPPNQCP